MTVKHRLHHLQHYLTRLRFRYVVALLQILEQFTAHGCFHDHDKLLAVDEGVEQFYDVFMIERLKRLGLFVNRLDQVGRAQLVANVRKFDGNLLTRLAILAEYDLTESADTKHLAHLIVV